MTAIDHVLLVLEAMRFRATRALGLASYRPAREYFAPEHSGPCDRAYLDALEEINANFAEWADPGEPRAPDPADIELEPEHVVRFPSTRPCGDRDVDRVALRVYPAPPGAPDVGVLFHHWIYFDRWGPADYLLKPLIARYRVAVMVAPHHMMRKRAGHRPGEGFLNPNVLDTFVAVRQWQADHAASVELLRRDHGFADTVLLGYSLGGFGSILSRMYHGPRPTVAVCVTNHLARGIVEGIASRNLVARLWEAGYSYDSLWWGTRALHLADWAPFISGADLTWMYARHDRIEPRESMEEPIETLRPERIVELPGGHSTAALFRERIAQEVSSRVEQVLDSRRPPLEGLAPAG